jgi:hypothetical protein
MAAPVKFCHLNALPDPLVLSGVDECIFGNPPQMFRISSRYQPPALLLRPFTQFRKGAASRAKRLKHYAIIKELQVFPKLDGGYYKKCRGLVQG